MFSLKTNIVIAVTILLFGLGTGWKVHSWKTDAGVAKSIQKGISDAAIQMDKDNKAFLDNAKKEEKVRVVYRTIREDVNNADIPECNLGVDYIRLWNSASEGASGKAFSSDDRVP